MSNKIFGENMTPFPNTSPIKNLYQISSLDNPLTESQLERYIFSLKSTFNLLIYKFWYKYIEYVIKKDYIIIMNLDKSKFCYNYKIFNYL